MSSIKIIVNVLWLVSVITTIYATLKDGKASVYNDKYRKISLVAHVFMWIFVFFNFIV